MVSVEPITTKYTPMSKKSAEPTIPISCSGSSYQSPVITGKPTSQGLMADKMQIASPIGMRYLGFNFTIDLVSFNPKAKE